MRGPVYYLFLLFVFALTLVPTTKAQAVEGDSCNARFVDSNGNLRPEMAKGFLMHQMFDVYRKADTINCDGHLSGAEVQKFEKSDQVQAMLQLGEDYIARTIASGQTIHLDKNGDPPLPIVGPLDPSPPQCALGWQFLLRDSAEDIGIFSCPKSFKTASGAQFGYSWDGVANNTSWSAKGVAALVYTWQNPTGPVAVGSPYVAGLAFSPWISFNRVTETAVSLKSKQVDVLSFGVTGEVALANVLNATQYFRAKPVYNTDFEGNPHSASQIFEWQPVSNDLGLSAPLPLGPFTFEVDPIVRFIHSEALAKSTDPIFKRSNDVSRVGPVVALTIAPIQNNLIVPHWLQSAAFNLSYEWLTDINTQQNYHFLNTSLTFPIDSQGHLGLKISYQEGQIQETGQAVRLANVTLSAKW